MKPTYPTPIQQLEELRCELKEAAVFNPYALASLQAIADTFGKSLECLVRDDPEFAEWAAEYPAGLAATKASSARGAGLGMQLRRGFIRGGAPGTQL